MTGGGLSDLGRIDSPRSTTPSEDGPHAILTLDPVFDALAHPERRFFLYALHAGPERTLEELAQQLTDWREERQDGDAGRNAEQTYLSLYHTHVPKLEACDVVELDDDTGVVTHGSNADKALAALAGAVQGIEQFENDAIRSPGEKMPET
ncbi:ArsR family transcriptional regulator [Halobacterium zhouii]|uniref:ArsR family transcriptional regulator n=1 Tax=Halobacterium zhouii TaxID=2902624 RepID=UPI001E285E40|nr:ArsR family transcriptional regulator [Halobacterium zhouii]